MISKRCNSYEMPIPEKMVKIKHQLQHSTILPCVELLVPSVLSFTAAPSLNAALTGSAPWFWTDMTFDSTGYYFKKQSLFPHFPAVTQYSMWTEMFVRKSAGFPVRATFKAMFKDIDNTNDLTFLRLRTKKHKIMVAPEKDYLLIVVQETTDI